MEFLKIISYFSKLLLEFKNNAQTKVQYIYNNVTFIIYPFE